MSETTDAEPLLKARVLRSAAKDLLAEDVDLLKRDLSDRPIGTRIKDATVGELARFGETAKEVAAANKPVIAATGAALAGWIFRAPIARGIGIAARKLKALKGKRG